LNSFGETEQHCKSLNGLDESENLGVNFLHKSFSCYYTEFFIKM
jgi:hypothetical protein